MRESDGIGEFLIKTFERVNSKYLHSDYSKKINVNNVLFEEWQGIITEVPPLLFLSFSMYKRNGLPNLMGKIDLEHYVEKYMQGQIGHGILPSIIDNRLDDVINRNKLDDLHIHLNGTTEIELLWRTALERPHAFSNAIKPAHDNSLVKQLYGLEELDFTQNELLTRLRVAKMLRSVLLDCAINNKEVNQQTLAEINNQDRNNQDEQSRHIWTLPPRQDNTSLTKVFLP